MQKIEHPKGKIYYTMGEVSEMFDVRPSLLRYWEQEFDIIKPHRNKKGNRLFTPQDVDNISMIYHLVKEKNMKLEAARKYMRTHKDEASRDAEIVERLMSIRAMLVQIKQDILHGSADDDDFDIDEPLAVTPVAETVAAEPQEPEAETEAEEEYTDIFASGDMFAEPYEEKPEEQRVTATPEMSILFNEQIANGEFAITQEVLTVSDVVREEEENGEKPPFQEQTLFEVIPEAEPDIDNLIETFIAKNYDEEADEEKPVVDPFADMPDTDQDQEPEDDDKPKAIEQTLF